MTLSKIHFLAFLCYHILMFTISLKNLFILVILLYYLRLQSEAAITIVNIICVNLIWIHCLLNAIIKLNDFFHSLLMYDDDCELRASN